ncbi:MAG TPA: hypothetical protein VJ765_15590 [Chitinophagaceae bacterium]|nr:hypothetical protein [Chitinophagaceae bacterium]
MIRYLTFLPAIFFILVGCGNKKKPSLSGTEPVVISDFIESFELVKPPYEVADTTLNKKEKDSLLISNKIFVQFVPDSVLTRVFGKNAKPRIYMGKRIAIERETYLFVKAITQEKKASLVLCFDQDGNFKAWLPLLVRDANPATTQLSGLDRRLSFYKTVSLRKQDGSLAEGKEVYIYNNEAGQFLLIMTDPLDDRVKEIINPIDTLARKHKFSADYVKDKMNLVSIRDDSKAGKLNFFIHIDRNNSECTGELKGVANITSTNAAVYKQPGDACSLQFNFSSSSVTVKEVEACGEHRGVKCSFEGRFPRKKVVKAKTPAKRPSK